MHYIYGAFTLADTESDTETDKSTQNPMGIFVGFCPCAQTPHNSKQLIFIYPLSVSGLSSVKKPLGYSYSLLFVFSACFFFLILFAIYSLQQENLMRPSIFDTHPSLVDRAYNRPRLDMLKSATGAEQLDPKLTKVNPCSGFRLRLNVPLMSPFFVPFKMASMQSYGAVYT